MEYFFHRLFLSIVLLSYLSSLEGCDSKPVPSATSPTLVQSSQQQDIRILTVNVWSGLDYQGTLQIGHYPDDHQKRYELLLAGIRKLAPDIIAIQEANPAPQYVKRLAADLGYQVMYHVSLGGIRLGSLGVPKNLREGEAILVKNAFAIQNLGVKRLGGFGIATNWLCFHFGEITQALLGKVIINGESFYIYAVHLHSGPFMGDALDATISNLARGMPRYKVEEAIRGVQEDITRRRHEIANLMKFIEDTLPAGAQAIILGDLNTTVESGELDPLRRGMWVDSYRLMNPDKEGFTWDSLHNQNFRPRKLTSQPYDILCANHERHQARIDFIMVSNNMRHRIIKSEVVLTPWDGFPTSDHYGVLTTVRK